jgi:hypothetical protein
MKDPTFLNTSNYTEICASISDNLKNFFNTVTEAEEKLNSSDAKNKPNPMNVILKKILLEINQKKKTKELGDGTFLLSSGNEIEKNDKIILINDSEKDFDDINQK